jgi:hypothetical protein
MDMLAGAQDGPYLYLPFDQRRDLAASITKEHEARVQAARLEADNPESQPEVQARRGRPEHDAIEH